MEKEESKMQFTTDNAYQLILIAIATWREARSEPIEAQRGVIWSILNRAAVAAWWNHHIPNDPLEVILMPYQYSSFNHGDPNSAKFPHSTDSVFKEIKLLVLSPGDDPTGGATHYFDQSLDDNPPSWAAEMEHTVDIGALRFYK
jgi:hypothetical protein